MSINSYCILVNYMISSLIWRQNLWPYMKNLGLKGFRIVGHMKICRNPFVWQKIYKYLECYEKGKKERQKREKQVQKNEQYFADISWRKKK